MLKSRHVRHNEHDKLRRDGDAYHARGRLHGGCRRVREGYRQISVRLPALSDVTTIEVPTTTEISTRLRLEIAASNIPHPAKAHYGGEDAWFVVSGNTGGSFGVADGVGGWGESNVNPGDYSRLFMASAKAYMQVRVIVLPRDTDSLPDVKGSVRKCWLLPRR